MIKIKFLAVILAIIVTHVGAFWNGNNASWVPFGYGTGYNNSNPWGHYNPFASNGNWGPRNDAANLSRYGAYPQTLIQYRQNPNFQPNYTAPIAQNRVKPSYWLQNTDFAATLKNTSHKGKTFAVDDSTAFNVNGYADSKAEVLDTVRRLQDPTAPQTANPFVDTDTIYGRQGYALSPAAASTQQIGR